MTKATISNCWLLPLNGNIFGPHPLCCRLFKIYSIFVAVVDYSFSVCVFFSIQTFLLFQANQSNGIRLLLKCDHVFKNIQQQTAIKLHFSFTKWIFAPISHYNDNWTSKTYNGKKHTQSFACSHLNCVKIDQYCEIFSQTQWFGIL